MRSQTRKRERSVTGGSPGALFFSSRAPLGGSPWAGELTAAPSVGAYSGAPPPRIYTRARNVGEEFRGEASEAKASQASGGEERDRRQEESEEEEELLEG